jgi:hypothetical protein
MVEIAQRIDLIKELCQELEGLAEKKASDTNKLDRNI